MNYSQRLKLLTSLRNEIKNQEARIVAALHHDFGKDPFESYLTETSFVQNEISHTLKHLHRWMRPERVPTPFSYWPARSEIIYEPKGRCLIIGAWNYPFQLTLAPLVACIAAGNAAVVKPSELTPETASVIAGVIAKVFPADVVRVVQGGVSETQDLLRQKWDHIFFTGSTAVGRIVYKAAAENLTPVTLELGGKSPAVVTPSAQLELAARRLVWGKFLNGGQTCIAPDYVAVHRSVEAEFVELLKSEMQRLFASPSIRIINQKNFDRLAALIPKDSRVVCGGGVSEEKLQIEPTLVRDVHFDEPLMQEEIFGPILPVLVYDDWASVLSDIRKLDKPLSAYLFSRDSSEIKAFRSEFSAGGMTINDALVHMGNLHLPFGGIGASGIGSYHGVAGFKTFSHAKSVMRRYNFLDLALRYPPYTDSKLRWLKKLF